MKPVMRFLAAVALAAGLLALQACATGSAGDRDEEDPTRSPYPYSGSNW